MKKTIYLLTIITLIIITNSCRNHTFELEQPKTIIGKWNLIRLDYVTYNVSTNKEISRVLYRDYSDKNVHLIFKDSGKGDVLDYTLYNNTFNFTYTDQKLTVSYLNNSIAEKYLNGYGDYTIDGEYLNYIDHYNVDPTFPNGTTQSLTYNRYVFQLKRMPY